MLEIDMTTADAPIDAPAEAGESLAGRLLIAMPTILDPRFARTVIYMFVHEADKGAMGLIVNRLADDVSFNELLTQLELEPLDEDEEPAVRIGGPVEVERGFVLHSSDYHNEDATLKVDGSVSMTATVDILRAASEGEGPREMLFALGYAGWAPGQLEQEMLDNGWLHCEADGDLVFGDGEDDKWTQALAKIGVDPSVLSAAAGRA